MRVGALMPRINAAVAAGRKLGMTVVWSPTDAQENYDGRPQRERALWVPPVEPVFRRNTVRAAEGRLSALSVFLLKSILYGAFVWARRALNGQKRRVPARAVGRVRAVDRAQPAGRPLDAPDRARLPGRAGAADRHGGAQRGRAACDFHVQGSRERVYDRGALRSNSAARGGPSVQSAGHFRSVLSLSDYASVLLFIWSFVWGLYERAHTIRYFPPLGHLELQQFGAVLNAAPFLLHNALTIQQLFALFDVECKHSVAARICAVGFVLLGAGAQEVHFCADYVLDLLS